MELQEFLEKESIRELRFRYSACIDGQDYDQLATLFAEDAVCEFGREFGGDWVGRETIAANYRQVMATDFLFADDLAVGRSVALVGTLAALPAIGLFLWGLPHYRKIASAGQGSKRGE